MAKILLTGSTGYVGRRLLPDLLEQGHEVVCLVRSKRKFSAKGVKPELRPQISVIEADLSEPESLEALPRDIDTAFYLIHSMSSSYDNFDELERITAENFMLFAGRTTLKQIIYLGGISNDDNLSTHLSSRKNVEEILGSTSISLTVLRAAIIIGSGSASFEIIRDLVEKLPVMVAPRWLNTRCQPVAIRNVVQYLIGVIQNEHTYDKNFDIGGPDILSYKEMLMGYAKERGLSRYILTVPVLTPKLSSLWLYFVTATSYPLARSLVDSMVNEVVVKDSRDLDRLIKIERYGYAKAVRIAIQKEIDRAVISRWTDSDYNQDFDRDYLQKVIVPEHQVKKDITVLQFDRPVEEVFDNIWNIGGKRGWYYGKWLWGIRGFLDQLVGGVGLRRGRRDSFDLQPGDALDFWRVLVADQTNMRLLLYAEMKLPGEAWLEFRIEKEKDKNLLYQTATFRPKGLTGRLYWLLVMPLHLLVFKGMANRIVDYHESLPAVTSAKSM